MSFLSVSCFIFCCLQNEGETKGGRERPRYCISFELSDTEKFQRRLYIICYIKSNKTKPMKRNKPMKKIRGFLVKIFLIVVIPFIPKWIDFSTVYNLIFQDTLKKVIYRVNHVVCLTFYRII